MSDLSLHDLREANRLRLPLYRNANGERAHAKTDGSDWSPAQWLQALVGELGEFAEVRLAYESGQLSLQQYEVLAAKELADVQCYLDILSRRALDTVSSTRTRDGAQVLMELICALGVYANTRKKFDRGDIGTPKLTACSRTTMDEVANLAKRIRFGDFGPRNDVQEAHPTGVDLAAATIAKFNEVSERVGAPVYLK